MAPLAGDLRGERRDGRMIQHRLDLPRLMQLGVDVLTTIMR